MSLLSLIEEGGGGGVAYYVFLSNENHYVIHLNVTLALMSSSFVKTEACNYGNRAYHIPVRDACL